MPERFYIACDLKSFYASVECVERQLDPMNTNLVVADESRTEKTICLAVSPSLKAYGISGRARLFEVVQRVREVNRQREREAPERKLTGESPFDDELKANPSLAVSYVVAPPRMAHYIDWSTKIYQIYLKYIAPEDIHVYSIDEVFMDVTSYLHTYGCTPRALAARMIQDVRETTGITAAAGIGTNLYLCKVAMDIVAKHVEPDENGVRIAELDEMSYRRTLWAHRPLTDFWRVGPGYSRRLEENGLYTMGDIARCSLGKAADYYNEDLLYRLFGVNAELLIDHAWGWEPCTIADVKAYKPGTKSICSGQVLQRPYTWEETRMVVREMADSLALDLVDKELITDQIVLTIGYDIDNLKGAARKQYRGEVKTDRYGRKVPKHAHGTENLGRPTASTKRIMQAVLTLYDRIIDKDLLIRRIYLTANRLIPEGSWQPPAACEQLDLFTDYTALRQQREREERALQKERQRQKAMLGIQKRFGKNAIVKGTNLQKGATALERNKQIGGHKA